MGVATELQYHPLSDDKYGETNPGATPESAELHDKRECHYPPNPQLLARVGWDDTETNKSLA